jgi:Smg protein
MMFDILLYLYDQYFVADLAPERDVLESRLAAMGFGNEDITRALSWLASLDAIASEGVAWESTGFRCYTHDELRRIDTEGLNFLAFLEHSGVLAAPAREWVLDRAMALDEDEVSLGHIKWLALLAINRLQGANDALWLEDIVDPDDDAPPVLH